MFETDPERLEGLTEVFEGYYKRNQSIFENPSFIDGCHLGAYMASLTIISSLIETLLKTEDLNPTLYNTISTAKCIHESSGMNFGDTSGNDLQTVMQPLIEHIKRCDATFEKRRKNESHLL